MKDNEKTQKQLLKELTQLRRRIAELDQSEIEHKRDKQTLQTANERLQYLLTTTSAAIYTSKTSGDYGATSITENVTQMTGYEPREFIENSSFWLDHVHPEDRQRIVNELPRIFKKGKHIYEYRFLHKDGHYIWVCDDMKLIKDKSKNPIEIIGYWIDITDRKQAEEALRESEEKYRNLVERADDGIGIAQDEILQYVNPRLAQMIGYSAKKIIGSPFSDFFMPDEVSKVLNHYKRRMAGKDVAPIYESALRHKNGSRIKVEINAGVSSYNGKPADLVMVRDITGRKQAEEALQQERNLVNRIMETSPVAITMVDRQGKVTFANARAEKVLGLTKDDISQRSYNAPAWHITDYEGNPFPDDQLPFRQVMCTEKPVFDVRHAIEWPDGHRVLLSINGSPLRDDSGQIDGAVFAIEDITKRRRAEENLKESESRFRNIIENSNDGIIFFDEKTQKILFGNGAMAELLGCSKEDLVDRSISSLHPSEEWASIEQEFQKHVRGEISVSTGIPVQRADGSVFYADISSSRITLEGKAYFSAFFRDITDRKRVEDALRESEGNFRRSLDDSPLGIRIVTAEGETIYANQTALEIYGYHSVEELQRTPVKKRYTPESYAEFKTRKEKRDRGEFGPSEYEISIVRKNGEVRRVQAFRKEVIWNGQRQFQVIYQDITERKKAEAQIERALRETSVRFEVSQALTGKETEDEVLDALIQHAGLSPQAYVAILTFDRTEREPTIILRRHAPFESGMSTVVPIGTHFPASRFPIMNLNSDDQLFVSADVMADERVDPASREMLRQAGATSLTFIPLAIGNELKGIIVALAKPAGYFDEEKQHLYQTLAEQGAVALRAARLRQQIRESQQRFQGLVETLSEWIWEADENGVYTYVSPKIKDLLGFESEEIVGKPAYDLMPSDEAERIKAIFESFVATKHPFHAQENTLRHRDGHLVVFEASGVPFFDDQGELQGYRGVNRDITARKKTEEALRQSEEKYRTILENTEEGYYELDLAGNFIFFNDSMCRIYGYPREELMGMNYRQYMDQETAKKAFRAYNQVYRTGEPGRLFDYPLIRKDKTMRYVEASILLQKDLSGNPIGFRGIVRDITDRKQAEERLKESEAQFRTLFEAIPDSILVHDDEGTILHVNEIGARQLEWSAKDLAGRNLREIVTPENRALIADHIRETLKTGWCRFETTYVSRSGWKIVVEVNDRPIKFGKKKAILRVARDITERKQAEKKIRESEEKYRDLVENINDILYITDEKGVITYISPTIESISGYTDTEIVGRSFLDFVYQKDMADAVQLFQQDISGQAAPHEYRMVPKTGEVRWVRVSSRPFFMEDRVAGLRGIITDITARKQAEAEVKRGYEQLQETFHSTVTALASAVEMKDQYTAGHQPRVTQLAGAIAEEMSLSTEQIEGIRMAASIHDIGKIMVPAEILNKPGPLTEIQYEMIKMHPRASYDILKGIKFPWPVAQIVLQHHERQDGSGYPQGLSDEEIMVEARILAVANVVEAMNAHRPYRPAHDIKVALAEISKNRGTLYDPAVVDACLRLFTEKGFILDPVPR
jgi:PAS domain S-box-containing protein